MPVRCSIAELRFVRLETATTEGLYTMTSHITIGQKLIISFGGMLLLLLGMAYSSLTAIGSLGTQLAESTGKTMQKAELSGRIVGANSEMRAAVRSEVLSTVLKNKAEFEKAR